MFCALVSGSASRLQEALATDSSLPEVGHGFGAILDGEGAQADEFEYNNQGEERHDMTGDNTGASASSEENAKCRNTGKCGGTQDPWLVS